jgi:hypothetical protein
VAQSRNGRKSRTPSMRREKGGPKKTQIGFRAPDELRRFVEERSKEGDVGLSDVAREAAELYRDLFEKLGPEWWEAERRAGVQRQSVGSVLAGLVKQGLEAERKKR